MKSILLGKNNCIITKWCKIKGMTIKKLAKEAVVSVGAFQNTIKRFGEHHTLNNISVLGQKPGATSKKLDQKNMCLFNKNKNLSMRDCSKTANTSYTMVQRVKTRNVLKAYKMLKQPKRSKKKNCNWQISRPKVV